MEVVKLRNEIGSLHSVVVNELECDIRHEINTIQVEIPLKPIYQYPPYKPRKLSKKEKNDQGNICALFYH